MPFIRAFCSLIIFLSLSATAESKGNLGKGFFFVEAGGYVNNIKQRLDAPSGYASRLSTLKGYLRIHPGFSLGKNWYFEPSLGTMLPTRDGIDGNNSAFESQLALQVSLPLFSFMRFRAGPGIEWVLMISKLQSVPLNNGVDYSTFYTPSRSTNVFLLTATAGFTFLLHNRWMIGMDLYMPGFLSSLRRRYNASLTLGFRL